VCHDDDLWTAYQSASGENHTPLERSRCGRELSGPEAWNTVSQIKQATQRAVAGSQP